MATTTLNPAATRSERQPRRASLEIARRVLRVRLAPLAVGILAAFILIAILANVIQRYDPISDQSYSEANEGPSAAHWLGTDYLGRDLWSRLVHGSRISLTVGLISVGVGLGFGVLIGVSFYVVNEVTANTGQLYGWTPILSAGLPTVLLVLIALLRLRALR